MLSVAKFTFNPFQENTYVVHNGSQALLIDPGCYNTEEERELEAWLAENALTPVRLVLTHAHIDHVFGCAWANRRFGLLPELHPADHVLLNGAPQVARMYGLHFEEGAGPGGELVPGGCITLGNDRLDILFVPGHAPGHVALYCAEQHFVIAGDVLFRDSIGRTDLPGGDLDTLLRSIREELFPLGDEVTVYCGHGPETTIGRERKMNPFLR